MTKLEQKVERYNDAYNFGKVKGNSINTNVVTQDVNTQNLDKLEKLEKVIEILKNKQVHIVILLECIKANGSAKLYNGYVELYNACVEKPFRLTQEEYNLLKEVLGND